MILCSLLEFHRYISLHPAFPAVEAFLSRQDLVDLPEGRLDLLGDDLYVSASPSVSTRLAKDAPLEAHRRYIDVQVVLAGEESMGWSSLSACGQVSVPYDSEKDIVFFRDAPSSVMLVPPGHVVVFFPEDAHAPLIAPLVGQGGTVKKLVVKVKTLP